MHVAHFHAGTVTIQTAGTQGGQTALMRQFGQRVGLIHELRKLRGTEKFFDGRRHGADVNQLARLHIVGILNGHALAHDTLQSGHTDANLVLQKLAHGAQTAVAQMVNVIRHADAVRQTEQIADRGHNIINDDVLGNEVVNILLHKLEQVFFRNTVNQAQQGRQMHHFQNAGILGVEGQVLAGIGKVIADHTSRCTFRHDVHHIHAGVLHILGLFAGQHITGLEH